MDKGAWQATVHRVVKCQTQPKHKDLACMQWTLKTLNFSVFAFITNCYLFPVRYTGSFLFFWLKSSKICFKLMQNLGVLVYNLNLLIATKIICLKLCKSMCNSCPENSMHRGSLVGYSI